MNRQKIYFLLSILIFTCCTTSKFISVTEQDFELPVVEREFRAAWIASVKNINWPSKAGLSTADQQKEAIFLRILLDTMRRESRNIGLEKMYSIYWVESNQGLDPFISGMNKLSKCVSGDWQKSKIYKSGKLCIPCVWL